MRNTFKFLVIAAVSGGLCVSSARAAEQAETARLVQQMAPPPEEVGRDRISADVYWEKADILQGDRTGRWSEWTETIGYYHQKIQVYSTFSRFDRFDSKDYAANFGAYFNFGDSYAHFEEGFGWDVDYIYNFQSTTEYAHKLYKGLYWQIGYNYRAYDSGGSHLVYPGLIYYFGDSYLSADYGAGYIEGRDTAHIGTVKGDFAITKFLHIRAGIAFGGRLYDISELDSKKEYGYIIFSGATLKIYKDTSARVGCSYSAEEPKFIKRSIDFALSVKF